MWLQRSGVSCVNGGGSHPFGAGLYLWQAMVGVGAAVVFSGSLKGSPSDPGENSDVHVLDVDGTECPSNAPINRCSRR